MSNDVEREQAYVSMLYARLDQMRDQANHRLRTALLDPVVSHQARSERDATSSMYVDQIARYNAVENGLCFGRLDFAAGERHYIGRTGIHDDTDEHGLLLMDWRAPGARPFYLATVASPEGVTRRRQIQIRRREVIGVEDEALDAPDLDAGAGAAPTGDLTSEAALLSAITASRTGQMRDIVETIQAEQDEIIRSEHNGVLVVDGGPGTGKTAVALHRVAYLLYTRRDSLASRAVLVVGPNPTFLRYIGHVLPGLGETAVALSTIGDLFPGVTARATEPVDVATLKGSPVMAEVIAAAVADRQRVPDDTWEIDVDRDVLILDHDTCAKARDLVRDARLTHNQGRPIFVREVIDALARQVADRIGADVLGGASLLTTTDVATIHDELRQAPSVVSALDDLWPELTPHRLLADLYADPDRIEAAAPWMPAADRAALLRPAEHRDPSTGWTVADVPLLDEAAELLGEDDAMARELAEAQRRREIAYAAGVLDILSRDIEDDPEILMAYDLIDADRLAGRQSEDDGRTVAERAVADRSWAYGHIVVDEAQELSAMAWRMLMRRCPSRSMTLVGDVAQTGDPAGTSSWAETLRPYLADRWERERLTVNYRTPGEVMDVAADVLATIDPDLTVPRSIRRTGTVPWRVRVDPPDLRDALAKLIEAEIAQIGDGRLAVLVPDQGFDDLITGGDLTDRVVAMTVRQAKGLEFDAVIVVEPAAILAGSPRGAHDLYVAVTRATRRLGILHTGEIPEPLRRTVPA